MLQLSARQLAEMRKERLGSGFVDLFWKEGITAAKIAPRSGVSATSQQGRTQVLSFDEKGFVGTIETSSGRRWQLASDDSGRLRHWSAPSGHRLDIDYNSDGQLNALHVNGILQSEYRYNEGHHLSQVHHRDGSSTEVRYGDAGEITETTDRLGVSTRYQYTNDGRLSGLTDPNGNRTSFEYENWNLPSRTVFPDGSSERYGYDRRGLCNMIARPGSFADLQLNDYGRPTEIKYSDGTVIRYSWNARGQMLRAETDGSVCEFSYDEEGRLSSESSNGVIVGYAYDADGLLTELKYPTGEEVSYTYDEDARLSSVVDWVAGVHRLQYSADDRERLHAFPNGLTSTTRLTSAGLVESVAVVPSSGGPVAWSNRLSFDAEGRLAWRADSTGVLTEYAYDAEGQLNAIFGTSGQDQKFAYDAAGNLTSSPVGGLRYNALNQVIEARDSRCYHDPRGNLVETTVHGGLWRYLFDARGFLVQASGPSKVRVTFKYDALGRRISSQEGKKETLFFWAGEQLIREEHFTDGKLLSTQDHLYFPQSFTPLAVRSDGEVFYCHTNHIGAPERLTDKLGQVIWTVEFSPFGRASVRGDKLCYQLRLPGQYEDPGSRLHYNRFRYYSPELGRFLSRDPAGHMSGPNLYTYAGNDPINRADPLGLWSWKQVAPVVASIAVGTLVALTAPVSVPMILFGAALASAVGFGLNEALNHGSFHAKCPADWTRVGWALLKGAGVGLLAALPFAFLPAAAGVAAFAAAGAGSGFLGYVAGVPPSQWSLGGLAFAVGLGAVTAGAGRYFAPRIANWWRGLKEEPPPKPTPQEEQPAEEVSSMSNKEGQCRSDPVDTATGDVFMQKVDFVLPGTLEIAFRRSYSSSLKSGSCLGPKWRCTWGQWIEETADETIFFAEDGRTIRFKFGSGDPGLWIRNPSINKFRLRRTFNGFEVRDAEMRILAFSHEAHDRWLLSAIVDRNGNRIQFNRDVRGVLQEVQHSGGYRLSVESTDDQISRIALITEREGGIDLIRYEYDGAGRLVSVIDGSGLPFRYQYDAETRIIKWEDRERTWYEYRYDASGRCIEGFGPEGIFHYRFEYDEASRTTRVTDSLGNITQYVYNDRLQVVARTDAKGFVTKTVWDERWNKLAETDPKGHTSTYRYDSDGNLLWAQDALGHATQIFYNILGLPTRAVDRAGKSWLRSYDDAGNLLQAQLEGEKSWRYEYSSSGTLIRVLDPIGHSRELGYNAAGQLIWETDWAQKRTTYSRDSFGRVVSEVDRLGHRTEFAYDGTGKLSAIRQPTGATIFLWHDAEGNLIQRKEPLGQAWSYRFGYFDVLREIEKPSGSRLELVYDSEARVIEVKNELGEIYNYEYDAVGNVVGEQDFAGRLLKYSYNASGFCIERVNGLGQVNHLQRDALGQLIRSYFDDGTERIFEYDPNGRLSRAWNEATEVRLQRDAFGRVVLERQGDRVVESRFDERGNRIRRKTSSVDLEWILDPNGQVSRLSVNAEQALTLTRDDVGRETARRTPSGLVLRQEYDPLGNMVAQTVGLSAPSSGSRETILKRAYCYNQNGNPVEIRDSRWGHSRFAFDDDGRISSSQQERGLSEAFNYDQAGDIVSTSSRAAQGTPFESFGGRVRLLYRSRGGRLQRVSQTVYEHDRDGRLIARDDGHSRWQFEWTSDGQLRNFRSSSGELWTYSYDALGRRIKKVGPKATTEYEWDGAAITGEIQGDESAGWVYEFGTFQPIAKIKDEAILLCVTDQVGTPRELIAESGTVTWSTRLSVWGQSEQQAKEDECFFRFQGQSYDAESGLHYNFHRYYDPEIGQYISPDPLGVLGGTRTYGYVHNPLTWVDPMGLAKGDPLPPDAVVHRMGGGGAENLALTDKEASLKRPGFSVLEGGSAQDASTQTLEATPIEWTNLREKAKTVGSAKVAAIRKAGFDVIEDKTDRFPNHARVIHPEGKDGFSPENRQKLSEAFKSTKCG